MRSHPLALLVPVTCFGLLFASRLAADPRAVVIPYVEAGLLHYSLEFKGSVPLPDGSFIRGDNKLLFDLPAIKLGLAGSFDRFSANVFYRATGEGSDSQEFEDSAASVRWVGDRTEYSVSAGYNVTDDLTLFGGYRDSETNGTGSFSSRYRFVHDGFFAGGSYRLRLTTTGALAFSAGYAWLDADLDEALGAFVLPTITGDGAGAKVGVVWRDLFNQNLGYSVAAEYFNYDYDWDTVGDAKLSAKMKETETAFSIGLFYVF